MNVNIMSPERKALLNKITKKYGFYFSEPSLGGFGLSQSVVEEIKKFNAEAKTQNEIIDKAKNLYSLKRGVITFFIILFSLGLTFKLLLGEEWIEYLIVVGTILLFLGGRPLSTIVNHFWKEKKFEIYATHEKSNQLIRYEEAKSDFILYSKLMTEKQREDLEKEKREYWLEMDGFRFEKQITDLYTRLGFYARKTKNTGDGGVDIFLVDSDGKNTIVQCKAHKHKVGPHIVRDLYGTMKGARADKAILINLGGFTPGVYKFIEDKMGEIELKDLEGVLKLQELSKSRPLL